MYRHDSFKYNTSHMGWGDASRVYPYRLSNFIFDIFAVLWIPMAGLYLPGILLLPWHRNIEIVYSMTWTFSSLGLLNLRLSHQLAALHGWTADIIIFSFL